MKLTMSKASQDIWVYLKKNWIVVSIFLFVSLLVHLVFFQRTSSDLEMWLFDWFDYFDQVSLKEALRNPISNYTGPYTYMLYLSKLIQRLLFNAFGVSISDIVMIKVVNVPFEILTIFMGMLVIRFFTDDERKLFYSFTLSLFYPAILINGALWGQCDIIYTSMVLTSFVFILYRREFHGILFFAVAVSIKFQAIFFSPLLLALILNRRMKWYLLGTVPVVYLILHLPSLIAGRGLVVVLSIYLTQANTVPYLTVNAANFYQFFPDLSVEWINMLRVIGLIITVLVALGFAFYVARRDKQSDDLFLLVSACVILMVMPTIMPSMLDRYFFTVEVFLLLLAVLTPKFRILPFFVGSSTLLVYYNSYKFNLGINALPSKIAAIINSLGLLILLFLYFQKTKKPDLFDQALDS